MLDFLEMLIEVALIILLVILLIGCMFFGVILLQGYAKIDNVCAELGITNIIKCGIINPAFQSEDVQQKLQGDFKIELKK